MQPRYLYMRGGWFGSPCIVQLTRLRPHRPYIDYYADPIHFRLYLN